MPASHRNDLAEKRRKGRNSDSPYCQTGRKEKKMASRSWSPSIWNTLAFWRSNKEPEDEMGVEEEEENEEEEDTRGAGESSNLSGTADESMSMMNISAISEDQVINQLLSGSPRQVRFHLPIGGEHRTSPQAVPMTPQRNVPYVAPLPPSSSRRQDGSPYSDPIAKVSQYLDKVVLPRGGECTDAEAFNLSLLIHSSVNQSVFTPNKQTSFAFKAFNTPSPLRPTFTTPETTLAALLSPGTGSPNASQMTASFTTTSPTRTLAQNPNGAIFFQGGGSARSRYRSSAFGSASPKKRISFSRNFGEGRRDAPNGNAESASPSDGKRRRVGEEKDSSVAQSSGQTSALSTSGQESTIREEPANGTSASSSTLPSTLCFGAARLTASTPVRPSPLRQSVHVDSSSPSSPSSSANGANGTTPNGSKVASDILAQIIESATPLKVTEPTPDNDVRNPYQVGKNTTKRARRTTTKVVRPLPRPTRTIETAPSPTPSPPKKLSAFETIQRTAPQPPSQTVLKRSLGVSATSNGNTQHSGTGSSKDPVVIELDDEDYELPAKKQRVTNGKGPEKAGTGNGAEGDSKSQMTTDFDVDMDIDDITATRPSEIIEPIDQEAQKRQEVKRTLFPSTLGKGGRFKSVPKDPSPLRQSFQPDGPPSPPTNVAAKINGEAKNDENINSILDSGITSFSSKTSTFGGVNPFGLKPANTSTSNFGLKTTIDPAPSFGLTAATQVILESSSRPFSSSTIAKPSLGTTSSKIFGTPSKTPLFGEPSKTPLFGATSTAAFDVSSTKPLSDASSTTAFGSSSGLSPFESTFHAASGSSVITPTFGSSASTSSIFSPTNRSSSSTATPTTVSATEPSAPAYTSYSMPAALATSSVTETDVLVLAKAEVLKMTESSLPKFEFAKPNPIPSLLEHTAERNAAETVAESDLPKFDFKVAKSPLVAEVSLSSESIKPELGPASRSFNWAAAGMQPPSISGWRCGECLVENKDASVKCVSCETDKPAPTLPRATEESKPVTPTAPFGFNWAAAGVKPPPMSGWRCGMCFVENKDASAKCVSCETDNPVSASSHSAEISRTATSTAPTSSFNWAAAGIKPPTTSGWRCGVCCVENKDTSVKCICCKSEKP